MHNHLGIKLAKTAGFCPGVKNAIDKALELAQSGKTPVYTLGQIIHNNHVIQMLEEKNIRAINDPAVLAGKTGVLIIRAHGVTPEIEKQLRSLKMEIIDATCPLVKKAQKVIHEYAVQGYSTVIVGDKGHVEVTGLLGYCEGRGYVAADPAEADSLPYFEKVNIVSQTTQEEKKFFETAERIRENSKESIISNTICMPTRERQKETVEMALSSDIMIVVGAKHSANTSRLAKLCSDLGVKTIHIEKEDELDPEKIADSGRIGVTAGASTPNWMTERVMKKLVQLREARGKTTLNPLKTAWEFIINICLYTAVSASALTYVCMKLQGCTIKPALLTLSGLFVMSLHIINRIAERGSGSADSIKAMIFQKHRVLLSAAGVFSGILAIFLSFIFGLKVFAVVLFFWILGILYPFRLLFGLNRLINFPASKDIATALGWGFMCAYVPGLSQGMIFTKANYLALSFAVLLAFMRSVMMGITAVQSDLMVGKENFYKAMGQKTTYITIASILLIMAAILLTLIQMGWKTPLPNVLLIGLAYPAVCAFIYYLGMFPKGSFAETAVDTPFLVMGLLTFFKKML